MPKKWEIAVEVFSGSSEAHSEFRNHFIEEIELFIDQFYSTYQTYYEIPEEVGIRGYGYAEYFSFNSLNCLLVSMNLLVSGLLVPSGNLMRSYCESLAWAILCSSRRLKYAHALKQNDSEFDGQKGIAHLLKEDSIGELNLDRNGVDILKEAVRFYNNYSHTTPLAMSVIRAEGKRYLGGFFDPEMKGQYKMELKARSWACNIANDAIENVILPRLREWPFG